MTKVPEIDQNPPISGREVAALTSLLAFGLLYDRFSNHCLRQPWGEQKSSLFVAGGVAATVAAMTPVIGLRAAGWLLAGFAASGVPMIAGQFTRYGRNYRRALARL